MAFAYLSLLLVALFVFDSTNAKTCSLTGIQECLAPVMKASQSKAMASDISQMCKVLKQTQSCISGLTGCGESEQGMIEQSMTAFKGYEDMCQTEDGSKDMGDCNMDSMQQCMKDVSGESKTMEQQCKLAQDGWKCVEAMLKRCNSKAISDMIKSTKDSMKEQLDKCESMGYNIEDAGSSSAKTCDVAAIQTCMTPMQDTSKSEDKAEMCKMIKEARSCLGGIPNCTGMMKETIDDSLKSLKESSEKCNGQAQAASPSHFLFLSMVALVVALLKF